MSLAEYGSSSSQSTIASPATTSTVLYVRGPDMGGGVGGLLYTSRSGVSKYNLSNGRGDIVAQSDASGSLTWTASYEAYGKRPKETGTNLDKQRANSKDEDPTGLLNEGFRYRDIETGVWMSRDPAGFVDGPNLYAYVRQNPWTAFDPDGLKLKIKSGEKHAVQAYLKRHGVTEYNYRESRRTLGNANPEPIDKISGNAKHDGSLASEIVARMISSDREFAFGDLKSLSRHVTARQNNVRFLEKLIDNGLGFDSSRNRENRNSADFYPKSWIFDGGWKPKGGRWKQALNDLMGHKGARMDCTRPHHYARIWAELQARPRLLVGSYDHCLYPRGLDHVVLNFYG